MRHENAILLELFRHNLWANAVMLDACRDLTAEQLSSDVAGTYGRLDQTLVHLARAQGGYLRTLADWQPGVEHRLEYDEPFPGVDRIAEHLRFTGERLIEAARRASSDRVVKGAWGDEPYRFPEWVLLLHAAHHATEHRQQIATILTSLGIDPPEPDPVAYWNSIKSGSDPGLTAEG
ncbi:MAG: DinB family protein [Candidatus Limnocylindria bacterium]